MNAMQQIVDRLTSSTAIELIGWLLVHSLWQFTLIAAVAATLVTLLRRNSSDVQYRALSLALLAMVTAPIVTAFCLQLEGPGAARFRPPPPTIATAPVKDRPGLDDPGSGNLITDKNFQQPSLSATVKVQMPQASDAQTSGAQTSLRSVYSTLASMIAPWLTTLVVIWCGGVLVFSLRPIISWFHIRQLCNVGIALPNEMMVQSLVALKQRMHVRASVRLLQSAVVDAPLVVGCLRCVILLPVTLVSNLPPSQLEAIIAHELSHVRRCDYLANLLQTFIETLFFYHPAVWWLSYRIRLERENCCDDLVVANSISKLDYGRALLAIQESRSTTSLALSAKGGSLLARVQRMLAEPAQNPSRAGIGMLACLSLGLITTLGIWASAAIGSGAAKDSDSNHSAKADESSGKPIVEFGTPSNGLQCRLLPVSPTIDVESPDLNQVVGNFKQSADMTFAVELKNVSDDGINLVGIRYGDSYAPESQGKLNTSFFAPLWFDLTFTDSSGKEIPRAKREFYEAWHMADGASVHALQPGQSLTVVLKPAELMAPFNFDLPPGDYRVSVRYSGPDEELKTKVRKHWPDKAILKAWTHSVESNAAAFKIEQPSNGARPQDLVWGQWVEGLQAAVEFKPAKEVNGNPHVVPGITVGSEYQSIVHVRNAGDKTITFISETARQGDSIEVTDEQGNQIEMPNAFFSGWPIDVLWTLQPGEEALLPILTPSLSLKEPGKYSVRYTIRFNSRQMKDDTGKIIFPRPGDFSQVLDTGLATLFLTDKPDEKVGAQAVPAQTSITEPFRLKDHWIVEDVQWINDDKELLTVSLQGGVNVRRWDVAAHKLLSEIKLQSDEHGRPVKQGTLKISRNGNRIIAVTDAYVGVWDAVTGELFRQLPIPKKDWEYDTVRCLDCSADGTLIVAGLGTTFDKTTLVYNGYGILWNAESGEVLRQFTHERGYYFGDIAMSLDGNQCVTCSEHGGAPSLWDLSTGKILQDFSDAIENWKSPNTELVSNNMIRSVGISPNAQTVAISGTFGVRLFDAASGKLRRTIDAPFRYSAFWPDVVFSSDGKMLARFGTSGGEKGYSVPVWSVESGEMLFELESEAGTGSFSSDGHLLAAAESDFYEAVSVWPMSGDKIKRFASEPAPYARINCVEENTHMKGGSAEEFADRWNLHWGDAQQGLQYGIAFTTDGNQFSIGQRVLMSAFLRNSSDKVIQFDVRPDMFGNVPVIADANGNRIELSKLNLLNAVSHYRDTLQPGEVFGPLYFNVALGENPHPSQQVWTPYWRTPVAGDYQLTHQIKLHVSDPQINSDVSQSGWQAANLVSGSPKLQIAPISN